MPIPDNFYLNTTENLNKYNNLSQNEQYSKHSEYTSKSVDFPYSFYKPLNQVSARISDQNYESAMVPNLCQNNLSRYCLCELSLLNENYNLCLNANESVEYCNHYVSVSNEYQSELNIKETPCCLYQNLEINNEETKEIVNNSEKSDTLHPDVERQREEILRNQLNEPNDSLKMSKDEMYQELLRPYQYNKVRVFDKSTRKMRFYYTCGYEGCSKQFNKGWSILDHVRMHVNIKPFKCEHCEMAFTQKCNLIKHNRRHLITKLKDRKRYKCHLCSKGFTERYTLFF